MGGEAQCSCFCPQSVREAEDLSPGRSAGTEGHTSPATTLSGRVPSQTTSGYVAVFNDEVVRHYQQFLDNRRRLRPDGEYRAPTSTWWSEFEEHFDTRKVELGTCGRPLRKQLPPRTRILS